LFLSNIQIVIILLYKLQEIIYSSMITNIKTIVKKHESAQNIIFFVDINVSDFGNKLKNFFFHSNSA
jgi:hypothetical protein